MTIPVNTAPQEIIKFWFEELKPDQWWSKDPILDQDIRKKYLTLHTQATYGELWQWRETSRGRLAEILILDQFSRNIYRGEPQAFAYDGIALTLAQEAIHLKADLELNFHEKAFLYLPFMHSESAAIHKIAVKLYSNPGLENYLEYEIKQKNIIDKFGRYPHRNVILKRLSTNAELEFLKEPNSHF